GRQLLRAAGDLERSVKRVATGWETDLCIAVADPIPVERIYPLLKTFYEQDFGTRLQICSEVLGGAWDALFSGRADLVIGAADMGPNGGGYSTRILGQVELIFVASPDHPLAAGSEPLTVEAIARHRAVVVADSSRCLPPRTMASFESQEMLTVPDMAAKCEAHRQGLGVGFVPRHMVQADLVAGRLVSRPLASGPLHYRLQVVWRSGRLGKALNWFLKRLEDPVLLEGIVEPTGEHAAELSA
ncbi:MAG: LysR substrate-binding domain-containing protein, partial [Candidatus Competibacteraceae bacterium]|nr:LysR substrate-binding domain-containing protein [Candidatus Competibacteraceae bacterium]